MRTVEYPRASLERCLELASAVQALGGDCGLAAAADRLGARPGGAFHAVVSAAGRYGFVSVRKGRLRTEPAYRAYRRAYDAGEQEQVLAGALANVPLFRRLLERFGGRALPEARLDRLLVREYGVPEHSAERVAGYFLDAVRAAGLLHAGTLQPARTSGARAAETSGAREPRALGERDATAPPTPHSPSSSDTFRVHVQGPGVDSLVEVSNPEDLELVAALLAKLERALRERR